MKNEIITKEEIISLINEMPDYTRFDVLQSSTKGSDSFLPPGGGGTRPYLLSTEEERYIEIRCEWRERHKVF